MQVPGDCQWQNHGEFSGWAVPFLWYRAWWYARHAGPREMARRLFRFVRFRFFGRQVRPAAVKLPDGALNLRPGDWVEVKPREEILASLDEFKKYKGLVFMPGMLRYCGRRFRVYKPVRTVLFEESGDRRSMRNTVLLDGLICDGEGVGCDRSCFFFWREAWLKRADGPAGK